MAKRLLIVEDDPNDELLMKRAFKKLGLLPQTVVVRDGAQALDYLLGRGAYADEPPPAPHAMLLDLNLPKVSGLDVLAQMRSSERLKTIPVILLTSSDEQEDRLRGYELGANSFVRKPVDATAFTKAITELGLYWLELNEPMHGEL